VSGREISEALGAFAAVQGLPVDAAFEFDSRHVSVELERPEYLAGYVDERDRRAGVIEVAANIVEVIS
jgi:hypothetical protein